MLSFFRSALAILVSVALLSLGPVRAAQAGAVTTENLGATVLPGGVSDRDALVRELVRLGVDPAEAQSRVEALTPEEVAVVQGRLDDLPAGALVGEVVGAILIVFLVLLITDIVGLTDVFPFVRHPARR